MKTLECSSKGDKRFSAFYARLEDGRTIEQHYQCDLKGYDPGGTNWRLGKGKPPLTSWPYETHFSLYTALWRRYLAMHPELLNFLCEQAKTGYVFTDAFSSPGRMDQAKSLTFIVDEYLHDQKAKLGEDWI